MSGGEDSPRELRNTSKRSRLPKYKSDSQEAQRLETELGDQLSFRDERDEGYPESPPEYTHINLQSRDDPIKKLVDTTNMVILSNLPDAPYSKEELVRDMFHEFWMPDNASVKFSKLPDTLFIYDLSDVDQRRLVSYMRKRYPGVTCTSTIGVPPYEYSDDTTEMILNIFRANWREQMTYREIYDRAPSAYLFLTEDFPYDTNRLVEVKGADFYGMRVKEMVQKQNLDSRHLMCLINVRSLAPLVHQMISEQERPLDRTFLEDLQKMIALKKMNALMNPTSLMYAFAVDGECLKKPLEHLVTCVPGVEVIWTGNRKVIRKLELPERAAAEPAPRAQVAPNAPPDAMRQEQEVVKKLSDILKQPSNLYMTLPDLENALRRDGVRVERKSWLRQFITERPKHFQILGESDYEVVTLSHRAQIKRVCNDLQKVLRPRKPKCISSADIAAAFTNHWKTANNQDRRFNVEDFGVCYLDDLLVTIPQHWGVHCSEYVLTDGNVIRRTHGRGEEEIPDFVPRDTRRVYAWIPRHQQTEVQKKSLALLKQQVLNMFRGDPTAETLIGDLMRQNRGVDQNRLMRLAYLRANRPPGHQGGPHHGRDNPTLPCDFEMEERTFVPLYHRFCGEQVALVNFGVKDLFELFDSMQDTFIASGHGQERTIKLTSDARREILERRLVDVLRMTGRSMKATDLLQNYKFQATMAPYYDVRELIRALMLSNLITKEPIENNDLLCTAKPMFRYRNAVASHPDVRDVLLIFMLSYAPRDVASIKSEFEARTGRDLNQAIIEYLENEGAIRRVTIFPSPNGALYDLHDVCRIVRNLVYKMNETPNRFYSIESHNDVSIASLLSFTGDFTFIDPRVLSGIMNDFELCFERRGDGQFGLRRELKVWITVPEEAEANQGRRGARGGHQAHRGTSQNRRAPRGGHQGHRGSNRNR